MNLLINDFSCEVHWLIWWIFPRKMLGCRVHIIGNMNRKRAWDHDRCWVRILAARVATKENRRRVARVEQDMARPWDLATAELTTFFGHVVLSQEQGSPRQTKVVCSRSRLVRNTEKLMFRPANGKFPMITVNWNPQRELPSLSDLHVIQLQSWNSGKSLKHSSPIGMYDESLNMQSRDSDESVLYSIKRSLNYCDWEHDSIYSSIPVTTVLEDINESWGVEFFVAGWFSLLIFCFKCVHIGNHLWKVRFYKVV